MLRAGNGGGVYRGGDLKQLVQENTFIELHLSSLTSYKLLGISGLYISCEQRSLSRLLNSGVSICFLGVRVLTTLNTNNNCTL